MVIVSRDRGTIYVDGATRGAPHALQIAGRWHLLHNLGEALEKVLARQHAALKRAFTREVEDQLPLPSEPQSLTGTRAVSQVEQARMAKQERWRTLFTQVQELSAHGWSGASIARMLGIHKKTSVKYATVSTFPHRGVIVVRSWLPICRIREPNGLPESTISLSFTSPFVAKDILARKPLCVST